MTPKYVRFYLSLTIFVYTFIKILVVVVSQVDVVMVLFIIRRHLLSMTQEREWRCVYKACRCQSDQMLDLTCLYEINVQVHSLGRE